MRLRAVKPERDAGGRELASFCGHCGLAPAAGADSSISRVCGHCGLGLVLQAPVDVAPARDEPFLVVDATLSVCAVSARAEELLGVSETVAVNKHIADYLVPADANAPGAADLLALLIDVASGAGEARTAVVRPREEFGVRFRARVGPCGPPRAALVVLAA